MLEGYLAFARGEPARNRRRPTSPRCSSELRADAQRQGHETERRLPRRPDRHGAARRLQALPRQPRLECPALRRRHRRSPAPPRDATTSTVIVDDDGPGHSRGRARGRCSSRSCGSTRPATRTMAAPGLGLSIARDIARSHGGDVTLANSPLGGLRATVHGAAELATAEADVSEQPAAVGHRRSGATSTTSPSSSGKPRVSTSRHELADLARREIDHGRDLPADQRPRAV